MTKKSSSKLQNKNTVNANVKTPQIETEPRIMSFEDERISFHFEPIEIETIPLGSSRVEVRLAMVSINEIRLDQANPRIFYRLQTEKKPNPKQQDLIDILWEDSDTKKLKRSIQKTQGVIEAIIVGGDGSILEGNCRVTCYHKLTKEDPENERWKRIKTRILPIDVTRDQISMLLGELHIAGKNEWKPFEQANHLYTMHERGNSSLEDLAAIYRMSKTKVRQMINAYRLMSEEYLPKVKDPYSLLDKWSYFFEFYKKFNPDRDRRKPNGREIETDFVKWMLDGKFKPVGKGARQIRDLPRILDNPEARSVFEKADFDQAWKVVEKQTPELGSRLFKSIAVATESLENAPVSELKAIEEGDESRIKKLLSLKRALHDFMRRAGVKV